tara:strand:- start:39 stop:707 length:669 start_codon:yes stop_codon:yes gene_type:complete
MTNKFSRKSQVNLDSCHPDLITLFTVVLKKRDCSVPEGHRSNTRQAQLYKELKTKVKAGGSKHNKMPSEAADVYPCPVNIKKLDANDRSEWNHFYHFVGYVKGVADELYESGRMRYKVRSGADWDGDNSFRDQTFHDLPHWELIINEKDTMKIIKKVEVAKEPDNAFSIWSMVGKIIAIFLPKTKAEKFIKPLIEKLVKSSKTTKDDEILKGYNDQLNSEEK